jgi:hypothetical protein
LFENCFDVLWFFRNAKTKPTQGEIAECGLGMQMWDCGFRFLACAQRLLPTGFCLLATDYFLYTLRSMPYAISATDN